MVSLRKVETLILKATLKKRMDSKIEK
jgi:hypothetical protein